MDTSDKSGAKQSQWYGEQAQWYPETTATDPAGLGPAQATTHQPASDAEPANEPSPGPANEAGTNEGVTASPSPQETVRDYPLPAAPQAAPAAEGAGHPGPGQIPDPAGGPQAGPEPGSPPQPWQPVGDEPEQPTGYAQHGPPPPFEKTAANPPAADRPAARPPMPTAPLPQPAPHQPPPHQPPHQGPPPAVYTPAEFAPPQAAPPAAGGHRPGIWHRLHLPIGVFLVAYGLTTTVSALISWAEHRQAISALLDKTIGSGASLASPLLIGLHAVEALLLLVTLVGLLRRRYVWFLPALAGWMVGFGAFAVLDSWAGDLTAVAEHSAYFAGFTVLLLLSYALGLKARVNRQDFGGRSLTRTQEMALAALSGWQRRPPQM